MGALRNLVLALVPASWGASMERDSRGWKLVCPCGHVRSVWEIGGLRWKASGEPRKLLHCPACGRWRCHRTTWRPEE